MIENTTENPTRRPLGSKSDPIRPPNGEPRSSYKNMKAHPMWIVDSKGRFSQRAVGKFHGAFPLQEIADGKRACREGWRNRGKDQYERKIFEMLAVYSHDEDHGDNPCLHMEIESAYFIEGADQFSNIEDMLATDWYVEIPDGEGKELIKSSLLPKRKHYKSSKIKKSKPKA